MNPEGTDAPNYGILCHRFLVSGQWDRALASALEWLGKEPENLRAHRVAAQALINLNRETGARSHLEKVLAAAPNDDFAHRLMSLVHFHDERFKEADDSIQRAIALNPHDAYHWHHLARMSYQQGDLATARKCAEKARELNPRDADILNLVILCEPGGAQQAAQKIRRYEEALELDPENAFIHNNIGAQYLDGLRDYAKAEECFRRALFFDPSQKMFRTNLFITVKHRDTVYRVLCAPKDFLFKIVAGVRSMQKQSRLLYILTIPLWLIAFRFILGGLVLWFMLFWPLTKVYEYLTIGDIRAQAGEIGARRGGLLGYRKWPVKARLSLFALVLLSFWGGLAWFFVAQEGKKDADGNPDDTVAIIGGSLLFLGMMAFVVLWVRMKLRRRKKAIAARNRSRRVENILHPAAKKRKWWQIFRRHT